MAVRNGASLIFHTGENRSEELLVAAGAADPGWMNDARRMLSHTGPGALLVIQFIAGSPPPEAAEAADPAGMTLAPGMEHINYGTFCLLASNTDRGWQDAAAVFWMLAHTEAVPKRVIPCNETSKCVHRFMPGVAQHTELDIAALIELDPEGLVDQQPGGRSFTPLHAELLSRVQEAIRSMWSPE